MENQNKSEVIERIKSNQSWVKMKTSEIKDQFKIDAYSDVTASSASLYKYIIVFDCSPNPGSHVYELMFLSKNGVAFILQEIDDYIEYLKTHNMFHSDEIWMEAWNIFENNSDRFIDFRNLDQSFIEQIIK